MNKIYLLIKIDGRVEVVASSRNALFLAGLLPEEDWQAGDFWATSRENVVLHTPLNASLRWEIRGVDYFE